MPEGEERAQTREDPAAEDAEGREEVPDKIDYSLHRIIIEPFGHSGQSVSSHLRMLPKP